MKSRSQYILSTTSSLSLRGVSPNGGTTRQSQALGFSLMEMLVVIGLLGLIAAFGLFISMDFYRGSSLRSEKNIIISVLQKARSRAVNNISESQHGVRFENDKYVIFQGISCSASGEEIPASNNIANSNGCVIFDQLTGEKYSGIASLDISGQGFSNTITINDEGRISW